SSPRSSRSTASSWPRGLAPAEGRCLTPAFRAGTANCWGQTPPGSDPVKPRRPGRAPRRSASWWRSQGSARFLGMPKSRLSRRTLTVGAPRVAAAPALGRLALGEQHAGSKENAHAGHAAMYGEAASAVGGPNALDKLLYPPPPRPHRPGRVVEYELVAHDLDVEVAPGVFFSAWAYH